jgi:hypothetical protein
MSVLVRVKSVLTRWGVKLGFLKRLQVWEEFHTVTASDLIIPPGMRVTGNLVVTGKVVIAGTFYGGSIKASQIDLLGSLEAAVISAPLVTIGERALVTGDSGIEYGSLVQVSGARVRAQLMHQPFHESAL